MRLLNRALYSTLAAVKYKQLLGLFEVNDVLL